DAHRKPMLDRRKIQLISFTPGSAPPHCAAASPSSCSECRLDENTKSKISITPVGRRSPLRDKHDVGAIARSDVSLNSSPDGSLSIFTIGRIRLYSTVQRATFTGAIRNPAMLGFSPGKKPDSRMALVSLNTTPEAAVCGAALKSAKALLADDLGRWKGRAYDSSSFLHAQTGRLQPCAVLAILPPRTYQSGRRPAHPGAAPLHSKPSHRIAAQRSGLQRGSRG